MNVVSFCIRSEAELRSLTQALQEKNIVAELEKSELRSDTQESGTIDVLMYVDADLQSLSNIMKTIQGGEVMAASLQIGPQGYNPKARSDQPRFSP